ncbi:stage III sporulation protein AD [Chakrabartyella piscis]|uniref:stage III sporulation protein AD n=1 Tax=Chakrabartyella piscis TaxID=2918914 RepID=UPI002958B473|nr:stage III sporulation protein AD [Chakrabartyella piscis]
MNLEKIIFLALIATIFVVLLKKEVPYIGIMIAMLTSILILMELLEPLQEIFDLLQETSSIAGISSGYFAVVWKIIGIAYLTQFASQICADAGENAMGAKVELAGKVCIMATSAPILTSLLTKIMNLT